MKIPESNHSIVSLIDEYHASQPQGNRWHLGASLLGHHCDRWLWLTFRHAVKEKFPGRILRLFRRGQNEEATVVADLKAIGCKVTHTGINQSRVELGGHLGGSIDGIIESGLPGAERTRHILEIKTHGRKSFDELVKAQSVQKTKPLHAHQMQLYMHGSHIDRALYAAVCKDDDRYYFERMRLNQEAATAIVERGHRITMSDRMPEPCPGAAPDWYQCKFCHAHRFCHDTQLTQEVNCRTCAHYTATPESGNHCARWDSNIPRDVMPEGCGSHVLHPDLVPWKMIGGDNVNAFYEIDGKRVVNGEGGAGSIDLIQKD